jgi:hypothetical protein
MRWNSLVLSPRSCTRRCRKFGLLLRNYFFRLAPNAKSDLDRPRTVYKSGVGQIMACGLFASKRRNRFATFFVNCRYTALIWIYIWVWMGISDIQPNLWVDLSIKHWWKIMTSGSTPNHKAIASLTLLVTWEIWNDHNTWVFYSSTTNTHCS